MGSKYIPKKGNFSRKKLLIEKLLIERNYDFCKVKLSPGKLECRGSCTPAGASQKYNYIITYIPGMVPKVMVTKPEIAYDEHIHMYKDDNSLCLYFPKDKSWTQRAWLFDTIIPWTHEWFLYYELYLITGIWHHPHVKH